MTCHEIVVGLFQLVVGLQASVLEDATQRDEMLDSIKHWAETVVGPHTGSNPQLFDNFCLVLNAPVMKAPGGLSMHALSHALANPNDKPLVEKWERVLHGFLLCSIYPFNWNRWESDGAGRLAANLAFSSSRAPMSHLCCQLDGGFIAPQQRSKLCEHATKLFSVYPRNCGRWAQRLGRNPFGKRSLKLPIRSRRVILHTARFCDLTKPSWST